MSSDLQSGPSVALKVFVTVCFFVWVAISYLSLFALATVFWVAVLESRIHPNALVEYIAALFLTLASAAASLWLWKRVYDHPRLYPLAAKAFAVVIAVAAATAVMWLTMGR